MKLHRIAMEGFHSLGAHKLRTFFMMAGTMIGVAALTVIMAIGTGTQKKVMKRVRNFGGRAMMLIAGGGKQLPPPDMKTTTLTLADARAVREQIPDVQIVSPMAWSFRLNVKRGTAQYRTVLWGVEPSWHEAWNWHTASGEGISQQDVAAMARVCVIGRTLRRELFGDSDPIGQYIYLNKVRCTVKGILEARGTSPMGSDFDNRIIMPITTAMRRILNVEHLGAIRIITSDSALIPSQADEITALIHQRHHISPPEEDDFRIITPMIIARLARGTSRTLLALLIALAALSLLVGGVVLMNILLISVKERTKEIGLRRALGATRKDIFFQFLTESLSVTILGMILGGVLGWAIGTLLPKVSRVPAIVSWEPFILGICAAVVVGTFFGVHPAYRAARLHPVEALR